MASVRIARLRRRVDIQQRATGADTWGQGGTTWATLLASVPADIVALGGRELITAQALASEVTHRVTVRYHPLLADPSAVAAMRIVYAAADGVTRILNPAAALNVDERNRVIDILAAEGLNQG